MKKPLVVSILVCVGLAAALAFALLYAFDVFYNPKLVTGKFDDVTEITVMANNSGKEISESDLKILFDELKGTGTTLVKHPEHLAGMYHTPYYTIFIQYKNGKIDELFSSEENSRSMSFFRFIKTGGADAQGYIVSDKNETVLSLIEKYFSE